MDAVVRESMSMSAGRGGPGVEPTSERQMRVFVSSTFRDMQDERDELIKRVFPLMRQRCESRGVAWLEVDLRWGITDEQKAEGRVLPLCLAEIDRCRPFFIGLLGERYGWVPEQIAPACLQEHPWLAEQVGCSVTELEILHGVLNDSASNALFYFRDPAYLDGLPEATRAMYRESPGAAEIAAFGEAAAKRRVDERCARLEDLKERIRRSGVALRECYPNSKTLGEWVGADLGAMLDRLYPAGAPQDAIAQDAAVHGAYARSRGFVYVERPALFARLDAHVVSDDEPLVICGDSGVGKSALLANWAQRPAQEEVIVHYVGAGPRSADWAAMVQRLIGELSRRYGIELNIPDETNALRKAFASALYAAAAKGRVTIVLDGVNQLEDRDGALNLAWLPAKIPAGIRLILSALDGSTLAEMTRRGWQRLIVGGLDIEERRRLIHEYLAHFAKALDEERIERIAVCPQTASPLYLRTLLDQVRQHGAHETLDERVDELLQAGDIPALYDRVLDAWVADYERDRPDLVRDAMSLIWAARRGLSEAELLDLLGEGERLPQVFWLPLRLAAGDALLSRSGLLGFSHDYLRLAVEAKYLGERSARHCARANLITYFAPRAINRRMLDELPWQLAQTSAWERLAQLLGSVPFLQAAWAGNQIDLRRYWAQIHARGAEQSVRAVDAYAPVLDAPEVSPSADWKVATLLDDLGYPREALRLWQFLVAHYRTSDQHSRLAASANMARIQMVLGELDAARDAYLEQEEICRALGDENGLQAALGSRALIHKTRGESEEALRLFVEQEEICRRLDSEVWLQAALGNRALLLMNRGDLDDAQELLLQQERICRRIGNLNGLQVSFGNQALIQQTRGRFAEALALHGQEEGICRELGNQAGLQASLCNQAQILETRGELHRALDIYTEAERIYRELGHREGLCAALTNQASVHATFGDFPRALSLQGQAERLCRDLGDRAGLQANLGSQARVHVELGDLQRALELTDLQEAICVELNNRIDLAIARGNRAQILEKCGEWDRAAELLVAAEETFAALDAPQGVQACIHERAVVERGRGDPSAALDLLAQQEAICRRLDLREDLACCLWQQALTLGALERTTEAQFFAGEATALAQAHRFGALLRKMER